MLWFWGKTLKVKSASNHRLLFKHWSIASSITDMLISLLGDASILHDVTFISKNVAVAGRGSSHRPAVQKWSRSHKTGGYPAPNWGMATLNSWVLFCFPCRCLKLTQGQRDKLKHSQPMAHSSLITYLFIYLYPKFFPMETQSSLFTFPSFYPHNDTVRWVRLKECDGPRVPCKLQWHKWGF